MIIWGILPRMLISCCLRSWRLLSWRWRLTRLVICISIGLCPSRLRPRCLRFRSGISVDTRPAILIPFDRFAKLAIILSSRTIEEVIRQRRLRNSMSIIRNWTTTRRTWRTLANRQRISHSIFRVLRYQAGHWLSSTVSEIGRYL